MSEQVHDIGTLQAMDEPAWAELQEDYYRRVYFYVKRYVGDHQTAEDLTQDVEIDGIACGGDVTFGEPLTDVRGSQPA